jgi:muramoyltetrapeptide carboxypeptidase
MALFARTGAVSWAGSFTGRDFGALAGSDDIMEACFNDMVTGQGVAAGEMNSY